MHAIIAESGDTVVAPLNYLGRAPSRPVSWVTAPPPGTPADDAESVPVPVTLHDLRGRAASLSLDVEGFELWQAPTAVRRFDDEAEVERHYHPDAAELALRATGAAEAYVFDHLVRRRPPAGPGGPSFGVRRGGAPAGPATRVHVDYTEASGARRFGLVLDGRGAPRRFAIVNVWRSIGPAPVRDVPLALCDARTVRPGQLVTCELRYRDRTGEIYLVRADAAHRWWWAPDLGPDEALVFKQYDSDRGVARFVPHTAFVHPRPPPGAPPRESIEVRVLVVFA